MQQGRGVIHRAPYRAPKSPRVIAALTQAGSTAPALVLAIKRQSWSALWGVLVQTTFDSRTASLAAPGSQGDAETPFIAALVRSSRRVVTTTSLSCFHAGAGISPASATVLLRAARGTADGALAGPVGVAVVCSIAEQELGHGAAVPSFRSRCGSVGVRLLGLGSAWKARLRASMI
jgi:hypothetical protein